MSKIALSKIAQAGEYAPYAQVGFQLGESLIPDDPAKFGASDVASILGETASYAALGSKLGPWGTAAGTAIGLGKGIWDEVSEIRAARRLQNQQNQVQQNAIDTIREQAEVTAEARKMAGERIKTEMSNRRTGMNLGLTGGAVQDTALRGRANIDQGTASDIAQIQAQADMAIAQMMREDEQLDEARAAQRTQNLYNAIGPAAFQLVNYLAQSRADDQADETTKLYNELLRAAIKQYDGPTSTAVDNPATASEPPLDSLLGGKSLMATDASGFLQPGSLTGGSAPAAPVNNSDTFPSLNEIRGVQQRAEQAASKPVNIESNPVATQIWNSIKNPPERPDLPAGPGLEMRTSSLPPLSRPVAAPQPLSLPVVPRDDPNYGTVSHSDIRPIFDRQPPEPVSLLNQMDPTRGQEPLVNIPFPTPAPAPAPAPAIVEAGDYGKDAPPASAVGDRIYNRAQMQKLDPLIQQSAISVGLPPALIKAVVVAESSGRSDAKSPKGAVGLMQLMPNTAKELGVTNPYDPRQNLQGGSKYLSRMMKQFGGDLKKALAAYNWGPGNVSKRGFDNRPKETRDYIDRVIELFTYYQQGGK